MDKLRLYGGQPLYGRVAISGAKNAALPLLAATLLAPGTHTLHRVPDLRDTRTMLHLLAILGARWERDGSTIRIDTTQITSAEAPYDLVKTMRASVLVLGPLLARTGYARVSLPGGCAIGARPINFHISAFQQMGAVVELAEGYVSVQAKTGLQGCSFYFDIPSVTGTENVLMAAARTKGQTVIQNAAKEPEIGNLVDMLEAMGVRIEGKGTDCLTVTGADALRPVEIGIIPDRIEAGTYLIAAGAAGGRLEIEDCEPGHLSALIEKLRAAGMQIDVEHGRCIAELPVDGACRPAPLRPVDIVTMPYPGFPTDLQAQFMALMLCCEGTAVINETIFENRFMHVAELRRLGAEIRIDGGRAVVIGIPRERLIGAPVMATDLRASASLVVAGLAASGTTDIGRIYHLERGYENMAEKLRLAGARVERLSEGEA